jgi:DDE superfamily endonuclease
VLNFINTMTYFNGGCRLGLIPSCGDREVLLRQGTAHTSSCSAHTSGPRWRRGPANIRHRIETSFAQRSSCWQPTASATISSPPASIRHGRSSANGATAFSKNACPALRRCLEAGGQPAFPPSVVVDVKRLACALPSRSNVPLARFTIAELRREVLARGLVAQISGITLWRWLSADALQPWRHRSWIFPRDPQFAEKAGRLLDLYARTWNGTRLRRDEFVISADEKPSLQARRRKHATLSPGPGRPMRIEHEYYRTGALTYLAAWDVHRATLFGRCEPKTTIGAVDRLVTQVMSTEPYRSARRVFWIADNCSSHRGDKAAARLRAQWPRLTLVHTPVHASWLNQIEIYFSIVQRKVVTPNDFASLQELEERLLAFQRRYGEMAKPFHWSFTRMDLADLLAKLKAKELGRAA